VSVTDDGSVADLVLHEILRAGFIIYPISFTQQSIHKAVKKHSLNKE
jgi:hypothetical protein